MNKNAIKKFATEARRELISRVSQRALKYGISEKETGNPNDDSVNGHLLSSSEKKQRAALIEQIQEKGYEQVMEEVAYTWFNRFSASLHGGERLPSEQSARIHGRGQCFQTADPHGGDSSGAGRP